MQKLFSNQRALRLFIAAWLCAFSAVSFSGTTAISNSKAVTLELTNALAGWMKTGIFLEYGDSFEIHASGVWDAEGLILAPRHVLWYRVSDDGIARNLSTDDFSAVSEKIGELQIAIRPPSFYWFDEQGTFPPQILGAPEIAVSFALQIRQLGAAGGVSKSEGSKNLTHIADSSEDKPPKNFKYLTILGESEVWSGRDAGNEYLLTAKLDDDVGIIKMPVDIELSENTRFAFDWLYESLPAVAPETSIAGHDYLSIALEFDNGQDLTWMWSKFLAKGTSFTCPLPWWNERETHYVLDSGTADLGEWMSHNRNIFDDYTEAVVGAPPKRIVGIWLIANNLFAKKDATASFRNLLILDEGERLFSY